MNTQAYISIQCAPENIPRRSAVTTTIATSGTSPFHPKRINCRMRKLGSVQRSDLQPANSIDLNHEGYQPRIATSRLRQPEMGSRRDTAAADRDRGHGILPSAEKETVIISSDQAHSAKSGHMKTAACRLSTRLSIPRPTDSPSFKSNGSAWTRAIPPEQHQERPRFPENSPSR